MPEEKLSIVAVREQLQPFFALNPTVKVELDDDQDVIIRNPWGDSSLVFIMLSENNLLVDTLNHVKLPERYSALWHADSKSLEVIYTALPLGSAFSDIPDRKFVFKHREKNYECEFARSSNRLMSLAAAFLPVEQSVTSYRNLQSFDIYLASKDEDYRGPKTGDPICFWIHNVDWDEDNVLALVSELNFYMTYFDHRSPTVVIHTPKLESLVSQPQPRFREGKFPTVINSRPLDDSLLRFWSAARSGDPASRFLYSYRIIEFASVLYLDANARSTIRRIVSSPSVLDNVNRLMEDLIGAIQETTLEAVPRFENLIKEVVSPQALWKELSINMSAFDQKVTFDGGFTLDPIAKDLQNERQFGSNGVTAFAKRIREIRNALSHGLDQRSKLPITPTSHNQERLQPWAAVVSFVAGEVIVYRDL